MSHTPGPWKQCDKQPDAIVGPRCTEPCRTCDEEQQTFGGPPQGTYGDHFGGHFVCESTQGANKALILAAPDLLEHARALLAGAGDEAVHHLERAIAKAEGRDAS